MKEGVSGWKILGLHHPQDITCNSQSGKVNTSGVSCNKTQIVKMSGRKKNRHRKKNISRKRISSHARQKIALRPTRTKGG